MHFYVLLLMAFLLTPTLSYAAESKCDTPIDCYEKAISDLRDARAEIDKLRQQAAKDTKTIENLRESAEKTNGQINALLTQLNTSAEQVAKLTDAVSVSEDGSVNIGGMKIGTVVKTGKENLTIPLGYFVAGKPYQIQVDISGSWAQDGGIYHIVGDWGDLPKMNLRSEGDIQDRLKFYAKMSGNGYYWLTVTWDNQSIKDSRGPMNNIIYFLITGMHFDTKNTTEFVGFKELSIPTLAINKNRGVGVGTSNPQSKLDVKGQVKADNVSVK